MKFEVKSRACTLPCAVATTDEIFAAAKDLLKTEIENVSPQQLQLRLMGNGVYLSAEVTLLTLHLLFNFIYINRFVLHTFALLRTILHHFRFYLSLILLILLHFINFLLVYQMHHRSETNEILIPLFVRHIFRN